MKNPNKVVKSDQVNRTKRIKKTQNKNKNQNFLGLGPNQNSERQDKYKVVSPPPTVDPYKGINWRSIFKITGLFLVLVAGLFVSWPFWSKSIVPYFPKFEYALVSDSEVKKLSDRIIELEDQVKGVSRDSKSIEEMERERQRLQNGVEKILGRLGALETALSDAKGMIAEAGVELDNKKAQEMFDQLNKRILQLEKEGIVGNSLAGRLEKLESLGSESASVAIENVEDKNLRLESIINNLRKRLEIIESPSPAGKNESRAAAVVLGVSQLRKTVLSGQPFSEELDSLRSMLVSESGIKASLVTLEKYGDEGVDTPFLLSKRFNKLVNDIIIVSKTEKEVEGWYNNFLQRIFSLASIRRIDGKAASESIDSYLLQAEEHLKNTDLLEAKRVVVEIKSLFPMVTEIVNPWLEAVDRRLLVERTVRSLHVTAITLIARTKK